MTELALSGDKRMTVKEVAETLGTAESTIRNKVAELFPECVRNGIATMLDEAQVVAIKEAIVPRDLTLKSKLGAATTKLEMVQKTAEVMSWLTAEADRLRAELAAAEPKIALADAIGRSDRSMSITDAAKHFGLHPKTEVFPYLRARGYLTLASLPTQAAIDAGYLTLREVKAQDGKAYAQAVVEAWQLENWRAHVVHGIKRWLHETAQKQGAPA